VVAHAKKNGMDAKDLRELKGQLMGQYHTDERGTPINILDDQYIKELKGKKKVYLIEHLKSLSQDVAQSYAGYLQRKATEGILSEEDRLDMAEYITPIFKQRGLKHKKAHITRSVGEQSLHYNLLLRGSTQTLIEKVGYKPMKPEEEKKTK
jgi:hypothetical protein